jgi:hypothetical protein
VAIKQVKEKVDQLFIPKKMERQKYNKRNRTRTQKKSKRLIYKIDTTHKTRKPKHTHRNFLLT